jgi:HTH-type transcriptional regulator / antitoxin HigA
MSTLNLEINEKRYGRLLAEARPTIIKTVAENERLLRVIEGLLKKGEANLSAEEEALLELTVRLVEDFEEREYPIAASAPHELVGFMLEQRGLTAKDLWPVLGSRGRVSDLLAGKREISKEQAKKLAEFFLVGVELFVG